MKKFLLSAGLTCLVLLWIVGTSFAYEDLVIYYSFDQLDGDNVPDMSGHGHDGAINGDITLADGKNGMAAKFTTGSFLDLDGANIPAEDIPTSDFSLCAWIKCENTGQDHSIFNARASDTTWLIHPDVRSGGQYRFCLRAYESNEPNKICDIKEGTVAWDEWIHYAGTYSKESGITALYINGEPIAEIEALAPDLDIAGDWDLGARVGYNIDDSRPFTGLMDDFCILKKALTQDEIQELMEIGPATVQPQNSMTTTWGILKTR
ncbi:LamG domain-containing protein [bacterium]|nr:LamG domain-containing protein [bacterium]